MQHFVMNNYIFQLSIKKTVSDKNIYLNGELSANYSLQRVSNRAQNDTICKIPRTR